MQMHFARQDCNHALLIQAFDDGRITVADRVYTRSLILSPERLLDDWCPQHFDELETSDFDSLETFTPEIVLLGTGPSHRFPHPSLTANLMQAGIGVEVMGTAAACRTFNILLSEGRRVVAALLLH